MNVHPFIDDDKIITLLTTKRQIHRTCLTHVWIVSIRWLATVTCFWLCSVRIAAGLACELHCVLSIHYATNAINNFSRDSTHTHTHTLTTTLTLCEYYGLYACINLFTYILYGHTLSANKTQQNNCTIATREIFYCVTSSTVRRR